MIKKLTNNFYQKDSTEITDKSKHTPFNPFLQNKNYINPPITVPYKNNRVTIQQVAILAGCSYTTAFKYIQQYNKSVEEFIKLWKQRKEKKQ